MVKLMLLIAMPVVFLTLVGSLVPLSIPTGIHSGLAVIFAWLKAFDFIIPVNTIMILLPVALVFQVLVLTARFYIWLMRLAYN